MLSPANAILIVVAGVTANHADLSEWLSQTYPQDEFPEMTEETRDALAEQAEWALSISEPRALTADEVGSLWQYVPGYYMAVSVPPRVPSEIALFGESLRAAVTSYAGRPPLDKAEQELARRQHEALVDQAHGEARATLEALGEADRYGELDAAFALRAAQGWEKAQNPLLPDFKAPLTDEEFDAMSAEIAEGGEYLRTKKNVDGHPPYAGPDEIVCFILDPIQFDPPDSESLREAIRTTDKELKVVFEKEAEKWARARSMHIALLNAIPNDVTDTPPPAMPPAVETRPEAPSRLPATGHDLPQPKTVAPPAIIDENQSSRLYAMLGVILGVLVLLGLTYILICRRNRMSA
ncbi:MAG: hypothetical protein HYV26_01340 [Candidatus Hydrogenedentes bacterium]|nr:hypothetical protein [Candidatus Hydrogenedentota bacterium]